MTMPESATEPAPESGSPPEDGRSPARPDGSDSPTRRAALWYALLFSVPVTVGVPLAVMRVTGETGVTLRVLAPGLVAGLAVFALVVLGARNGTAEPR